MPVAQNQEDRFETVEQKAGLYIFSRRTIGRTEIDYEAENQRIRTTSNGLPFVCL